VCYKGVCTIAAKYDTFLISALISASGFHVPAELFPKNERTYLAKKEVIGL